MNRRRVLKWGGIILLLAIGGFLVALSGIVPITASGGHWAVTEWILQFGKRRSISTHSISVTAPPLDDSDRVLKGATHYDTGCRSCHGSPGGRQPRIALNMLPPPPELATLVPERTPEQLFYVVKHGLKFTGMPAWPAQERDDEVWALVAFLRTLPELDAESYDALVQGDAPETAPIEDLELSPGIRDVVTASCVRCHGVNGRARGDGAFPHLAGQRPDYLKNALAAYASGRRNSGIMEPIAAALDEGSMTALAQHYTRLPPPPGRLPEATEADLIAQGADIARHGLPGQRVPSCIDCHTPTGRRTKAAYPNLAGQPADYLLLQLELFKNDQRGGSEYAHLMETVASGLEPDQMRAVALYFESLAAPDGSLPSSVSAGGGAD